MKHLCARSLIALALVTCLAGCGHNRGDRAASGGLLGAAGGAGIAAITGGSPLVGAAIGGAAGALGGAVTSGHDVNLGRPLWR
jgi:osmotically inducible lipoprotein OsmB